MIPRALLLAICLFWMAYQSQFSPAFFMHMVKASLADIESGIDAALTQNVDGEPQPATPWHTASTQ
jgi:hypothetical protein